jgi:hypothetical protein
MEQNTLGSRDVGERPIGEREAQTVMKYSMSPRIFHRIGGVHKRYGIDLMVARGGIEPPTRGFSGGVPNRVS